MKTYRIILALLVALVAMPAQVMGQTSDQASLTVTATAVAPLSLTNNADVNFGVISLGQTATLDPIAGAHSGASGANVEVGQVDIGGAAGSSVGVSYTTTVTLGDGDAASINYTPSIAGHETTQASASLLTNGQAVTLDGSGDYKLWIGGSLTAPSVAAVYSSEASNGTGSLVISIEYF